MNSNKILTNLNEQEEAPERDGKTKLKGCGNKRGKLGEKTRNQEVG